MSGESEEFISCGGLPDLGSIICTTGRNPLSIRGENCSQDPGVMPSESEQLLRRHCLPKLCGLILAAGEDVVTIRRNCCRQHSTTMPAQTGGTYAHGHDRHVRGRILTAC